MSRAVSKQLLRLRLLRSSNLRLLQGLASPGDALMNNCLASHAFATTSGKPVSQAFSASASSGLFAFRHLAIHLHNTTLALTSSTLPRTG